MDNQLNIHAVKLSSLTQAAACAMTVRVPGEHRQAHQTVDHLTLHGELRWYLMALRSDLAR